MEQQLGASFQAFVQGRIHRNTGRASLLTKLLQSRGGSNGLKMCRRCQAPDNRYFVKDLRTGRLVCEECGFAVISRSPLGYRNGDYIWNLNPAWPEFHSCDQLIRSIRFGNEFHLPPCKPLVHIPSQLLTFAFDLHFQHESGRQERE